MLTKTQSFGLIKTSITSLINDIMNPSKDESINKREIIMRLQTIRNAVELEEYDLDLPPILDKKGG